ncbi:hypothetical protein [Melittangium boletus]|uniref:Uncharacterized protein n=1 Tax=Melittangium boletus DSM 14713 TaxID=1294270 RepID=A0A250ITR4_9BACT|nr:hypothetical protein [Melittangium boletus]ATB34316.1 hypothetical protein MEBOL_007817 [Melittangium boletus DSM 14713]
MSALLIRLVCGLLFAALVLGAVAHPPQDLSQGLGMLLPGGMLLGYALRGPRRSMLPKRKPSQG